MPVTKTAKRALRVVKRKGEVNSRLHERFEIALRLAKKQRTKKSIKEAVSLIDRSVKKNLIHKNKAAHLKSTLSKLTPKASSK